MVRKIIVEPLPCLSACIFKFFQNMIEEGEYLKQYLNPNHTARLLSYNRSSKGGNLSHEEITKKYFQTLDVDDIMKLYKIYEKDFRVFGYTFKMGNLTLPPPTPSL